MACGNTSRYSYSQQAVQKCHAHVRAKTAESNAGTGAKMKGALSERNVAKSASVRKSRQSRRTGLELIQKLRNACDCNIHGDLGGCGLCLTCKTADYLQSLLK